MAVLTMVLVVAAREEISQTVHYAGYVMREKKRIENEIYKVYIQFSYPWAGCQKCDMILVNNLTHLR
jgi:hypothetical protein